MCIQKTFLGEPTSMEEMLASGQAVSSASMHEWQATHLNPNLKACGTLPECRESCPFSPQTAVTEMANRVAQKIASE